MSVIVNITLSALVSWVVFAALSANSQSTLSSKKAARRSTGVAAVIGFVSFTTLLWPFNWPFNLSAIQFRDFEWQPILANTALAIGIILPMTIACLLVFRLVRRASSQLTQQEFNHELFAQEYESNRGQFNPATRFELNINEYDHAFHAAFCETIQSIAAQRQLERFSLRPMKKRPLQPTVTALAGSATTRETQSEENPQKIDLTQTIGKAAQLSTAAQQTEVLLTLEDTVARKNHELTELKFRYTRLLAHKQEIEDRSLQAKQLLLQAKTEVRKNMQARATALHTAQKAVLLSKRSVAARIRAEAQISSLQQKLQEQQRLNLQLSESLHRNTRILPPSRKTREATNSESAGFNPQNVLANRVVRKTAKHATCSNQEPEQIGSQRSIEGVQSIPVLVRKTESA